MSKLSYLALPGTHNSQYYFSCIPHIGITKFYAYFNHNYCIHSCIQEITV